MINIKYLDNTSRQFNNLNLDEVQLINIIKLIDCIDGNIEIYNVKSIEDKDEIEDLKTQATKLESEIERLEDDFIDIQEELKAAYRGYRRK